VDRLSTEQFRCTSGVFARQVADESGNDNSAAPHTLAFLSATGGRENAKGANTTHAPSLIRDLEIRRHTLGWSIKELGDRCGIDEKFLGDWECGVSSPQLDAIEHWAAALGLTLAFVRAEHEARHGLLVDWDKRRVAVDDTPIRLTPMEWKALERLAWTPGELVTHQALFRYLYGDDRQHRAQSTAVRVLITKLRRLLPIRIEARWGQGYVISGIEPALPPHAHRADDGVVDGGAMPQPEIAEKPCGHVALTSPAAPRDPPPIRRELASLSDAGARRAAAAPTRPNPCRAEELGVIERFLAERGVTRCPDLTTIQQSPLPTLVWDKVKRKWVRPSATSCEAG
jgi:transcriptional regulator with XRE-family HTH domain